jgi:hypothetical protein
MKYLSADILPKVFHGLILVLYIQYTLTVINNQNWLKQNWLATTPAQASIIYLDAFSCNRIVGASKTVA